LIGRLVSIIFITESVAPTDTTSLAQDSSTDLSKPIVEVNEQNGDVAAAQGKSTTTETVHENVVASGSGLEGFENSQEEEGYPKSHLMNFQWHVTFFFESKGGFPLIKYERNEQIFRAVLSQTTIWLADFF